MGRAEYPGIIFADGELIEAEHWHEVKPKASLIIHRVPEQGAARVFATIAVIAAAAYVGPIAAAAAFGPGVSAGTVAAVTAGIGLVGNLALNALIPPPTPSAGGGGSPEQLATLAGQSNQVTPFAPIPRAYGQVRWYPPIPMTALPYTELQGQDQYLRMMLCLGYGPLQIGGVQVGGPTDDPIVRRLPTATQVGTGTLGSGSQAGQINIPGFGWITIPQSVDQSPSGGTVTSLSGTPIKIGGTDIAQFDDVEYEIGRPDQISLYTRSVIEEVVGVSMPISSEPSSGQDVTVNDGQQVVRTTEADTDEVELDLFAPTFFTMGESGRVGWSYVDFKVEYRPAGSGSYTTAIEQWRVGSSERRPIREGRRIVMPSSGTWDIRVTRVQTFLHRTASIATDFQWTVLRSIRRDQRPFDVPGTVVMALRIRATDQLGGRLDRLSVETTSVLPTWNGSAWVDAPTRLAAWVYTDILSGSATRSALPKSRVAEGDLEDWADWCAANDIYFDGVITTEGTVFDRARDAAAAGFGAWHVRDDGRASIILDQPSTSKMLISPRTARDFTAEKIFHKLPHALRVQFIDPETLEATERIVYDDGYSADGAGETTAATRFEQLPTVGVRDPDLAWKQGRYHLASLRRRPEIYHWTQEIQHLAYDRGSTVDIAYDVILVGMAWGRIKSVTLDGNDDVIEAVVDELLVMESGPDYALKIQRQDGSIVTEYITTVTPGTTSVTFNDPVSGIKSGDHFTFGIGGKITLPARISRIEPQGNFRARLTAVPAADDIFDAWDGVIPPFDPVITEPVDESLLPPPVPVIVNSWAGKFADGASAISLEVGVAFTMPPGLSDIMVEARVRTHEEDVDGEGLELWSRWRRLPGVSADEGVIIISASLENLATYDIQLRSRRGNRLSSWTASEIVNTALADGLDWDRILGEFKPEDAAKAENVVRNPHFADGPLGWVAENFSSTSDPAGWGEIGASNTNVQFSDPEDAYLGERAIFVENTSSRGRLANGRETPADELELFYVRCRARASADTHPEDNSVHLGLFCFDEDGDFISLVSRQVLLPDAVDDITAWNDVGIWIAAAEGTHSIRPHVRPRVFARSEHPTLRTYVDDVSAVRLGVERDLFEGLLSVNPNFIMRGWGWFDTGFGYSLPAESGRVTGRDFFLQGGTTVVDSNHEVEFTQHRRFRAYAGDKVLAAIAYSSGSQGSPVDSWRVGVRWRDDDGDVISTSWNVLPHHTPTTNIETEQYVVTAPAGARTGQLLLGRIEGANWTIQCRKLVALSVAG